MLGWVRSGFSAHGAQRVPADDFPAAERLGRYITRAPIALDRLVFPPGAGHVLVATPPDPRTGATELRLDALDWIRAFTFTAQIPDRGQHLVRYYGWYSSRSRGAQLRARGAFDPARAAGDPGAPVAEPSRA